MPDTVITWADLRVHAEARLQETAVLSPGTEARWMVERVSGYDGVELVVGEHEAATTAAIQHLDDMLERRAVGEPLQYVLGRWEFLGLDLMVDRRVLIPRPETEEVVDVALELASQRPVPRLVADLGTGSGAIALSMALELPRRSTTVWATDFSADALDVCRANLAGIGVAGNSVRLAEGAWFAALPPALRGQFELVVSNPPYIADDAAGVESAVADWEPRQALFAGADGLDDLRTIINEAPAWLAPGGWVVLEIGADQGVRVATLLQQAGLVDGRIRQDLAGHDRIAIARTPDP